jgi:hypothetical protein
VRVSNVHLSAPTLGLSPPLASSPGHDLSVPIALVMRAIAYGFSGPRRYRASWFETAPEAPPHHEGLGFRRGKSPHPEEPHSGVSKDGRKDATQTNLEPYAIALPFVGRERKERNKFAPERHHCN